MPKSNEVGVRGGSGGEVFSSKNPAIWHSQLGYEGLGKTPENVYLVEVKNPQTTKMQVEGVYQNHCKPQMLLQMSE